MIGVAIGGETGQPVRSEIYIISRDTGAFVHDCGINRLSRASESNSDWRSAGGLIGRVKEIGGDTGPNLAACQRDPTVVCAGGCIQPNISRENARMRAAGASVGHGRGKSSEEESREMHFRTEGLVNETDEKVR